MPSGGGPANVNLSRDENHLKRDLLGGWTTGAGGEGLELSRFSKKSSPENF